MKQFLTLMDGMVEYRQMKEALQQGRVPVSVSGVSASHKTHIIASLAAQLEKPALVIVPDESTAIRFTADLSVLLGERVLHFPARDYVLLDVDGASGEFEHQRLGVLSELLQGTARVVVASAESACERTIPKETLKDSILTIDMDGSYDQEQVVKKLVAMGYQCRDQVEGICQFARRGGILDIFPPDRSEPVRIEFWDDEIDTMSTFQVDTQRRQDSIEQVTIPPAREVLYQSPQKLADLLRQQMAAQKGKAGVQVKEHLQRDIERLEGGLNPVSIDRYLPILYQPQTIFDYFEADALAFLCEPVSCKENFANAMAQHHEDVKMLMEQGILFRGCSVYYDDFTELCRKFCRCQSVMMDTFTRSLSDVPVRELVQLSASQLSTWSGEYAILKDDIEDYMKTGFCCVIFAGTPRGAQALTEDLQKDFSAQLVRDVPSIDPGRIYVLEGTLSAGMEYPQLKLAVISHAKTGSSRKKPAKAKKGGIKNISDLNVGDYVVHVSHGIGIFEGIVKRDIHGVVKDYIKIRYAGSDMLFVPVTQLDLVTKYIGGKEDSVVKLNKLNSAEWAKTRARVKKAVKDMADELIKLYAKREAAQGYAFGPDTDWQNDFERRFPYDETDDQLRCIREIKDDMEKPSPMDRLLCGDVGFGKTEVAIRAAFKCVMDGKQCAVLVPTTILAWQHYQTFRKRMEGFPVKVDILSRFRTPREQEQVLEELRRGQVDIVVGTHRLVQKDVKFKDLGLCIIDEEQRFGVGHKEQLKNLRESVDVLTLSATPIPRTLQMSLSGVRDMSLIRTPPPNRRPVVVHVGEWDEDTVSGAIRREMERGGQVYYVSNRVRTIDDALDRVVAAAPEARVGVAHGKMGPKQIEAVMEQFSAGEIDVLVATTIVESGLDNPHTNTLIIEDSQRLGLAQLYQLKGRVGRSGQQAYAYFLFPPEKPLTEEATERLQAIGEFTDLGSGMKVAMKDLEIRGAGSILGAEQSGNMSAVGFDLFASMLAQAVSDARGEEQIAHEDIQIDLAADFFIPEEFMPATDERVLFYRRIAAAQGVEDVDRIAEAMQSKYGVLPEPARNMLDRARLKALAAECGVTSITQSGGKIVIAPVSSSLKSAATKSDEARAVLERLRALYFAKSEKYTVPCSKGEPALAVALDMLEALATVAEDNR